MLSLFSISLSDIVSGELCWGGIPDYVLFYVLNLYLAGIFNLYMFSKIQGILPNPGHHIWQFNCLEKRV